MVTSIETKLNVNIFNTFKMKLKILLSHLEKEDLSQFLYLKEQSECIEDHDNFANYIENSPD